jgi:hypothetical protein
MREWFKTGANLWEASTDELRFKVVKYREGFLPLVAFTGPWGDSVGRGISQPTLGEAQAWCEAQVGTYLRWLYALAPNPARSEQSTST